MIKLTHYLIITIFFFSCNPNGDGSRGKSATSRSGNNIEAEKAPVPADILEKGELIYRKHCFACHQENGSGLEGMFPPLSETKTVNGPPEKLIGIVLNGLTGKIEVKGEFYDQVMIPHNFLNDKEIANLLSYVRNSFGNSAGRVTEEEVAKVRGSRN